MITHSMKHRSLCRGIQSLSSLVKSTALNEIAVVILSKSGNTTETVLNATFVAELLTKQYGKDAVSRIIYVGNTETPLMKACEAKGILTIAMPEIVGGRYSV